MTDLGLIVHYAKKIVIQSTFHLAWLGGSSCFILDLIFQHVAPIKKDLRILGQVS